MKKTRNLLILLVFILLLTNCRSALVRASENGNIETANTLIDQGADIEEISIGYTPLSAAARYEKLEMVKLLLDRGADVNGKESDGMNALHWAAYMGNAAIAEILINHGADVNIKTSMGGTALSSAVFYGHNDVVKILLEHGAVVNEGENLIRSAEYTLQPQIVSMLKAAQSKGAPIHVKAIPKSVQIGSITSLNAGKREVVVSSKQVLKIGELVYVLIDGNKVILSATFPMMTSTRCQLEGDDTKYFEKLSKGMPVYKY